MLPEKFLFHPEVKIPCQRLARVCGVFNFRSAAQLVSFSRAGQYVCLWRTGLLTVDRLMWLRATCKTFLINYQNAQKRLKSNSVMTNLAYFSRDFSVLIFHRLDQMMIIRD